MISPWLGWVRRLQAVAQNGIHYAASEFERERFEEVRAIAVEIGALGGAPVEELAATFAAESGHATPKVDVRAAAFREDGRVLLVRGLDDGRWTVPGGWAEVGESPSAAVEKELREESGYTGQAAALIGIFERDARDRPQLGFYAWKVWFRCELGDGEPAPPQATEITDVGFFAEDDLPDLSQRTPPEQLAHAFAHLRDPSRLPVFD